MKGGTKRAREGRQSRAGRLWDLLLYHSSFLALCTKGLKGISKSTSSQCVNQKGVEILDRNDVCTLDLLHRLLV